MTKYYKPISGKYLKMESISYPIGHILITSTNTNPGTYMDGTWTLIDKEFSVARFTYDSKNPGTDPIASINTTNLSRGRVWITRIGHGFYIEFSCIPKVNITDATIEWMQLNISKIGVDANFSHNHLETGWCDGSNGIIQLELTTLGLLHSYDAIVRGSSGALPSGNTVNVDYKPQLNISDMLDSACDKFYWKRIA